MKGRLILVLLAITISQALFGLQVKNTLSFKTSGGHLIKVFKGTIFYDGKRIFKMEFDDILYESKSNTLLEDHGSVFLFIAVDGRPNEDRLNAFLITQSKATLLADAILSPLKDFDGDGYLEFGGRDLTEVYPNRDSMYYIPSAYYEIRNGEIHPDKKLTISKDIALNGLYLSGRKQLDKDGYCCTVIPTPGRKAKKWVKPDSIFFVKKSFMGSDTVSVFASIDVLLHKSDILYVTHDSKGVWKIYGKDRFLHTVLTKVKLAAIIKIDKSILLLSWMPKGDYAERSSKTGSWVWDKLL